MSAVWTENKEIGTKWGMLLLIQIYKILGATIIRWILLPLSFYYYLCSSKARNASNDYIARYTQYCLSKNITPKKLNPFLHINAFANSILDKFLVWMGAIQFHDLDFREHELLRGLAQSKVGVVFISSHFGNIEICRSLSRYFPELKINVLMYNENAVNFNSVLQSINKDVSMNIIPAHKSSVDTIILLEQKVAHGEWVFIMGDRLSVNAPHRQLKNILLGDEISLPIGPFVVAELLKTPVFTMHCYAYNDGYRVQACSLFEPDKESGLKREERHKKMSDRYVQELESLILSEPLQWFNFYQYWEKNV